MMMTALKLNIFWIQIIKTQSNFYCMKSEKKLLHKNQNELIRENVTSVYYYYYYHMDSALQ